MHKYAYKSQTEKWQADKPVTAEREKMGKVVRKRMKDYHEKMIIMAFAENHQWDYEDGDLVTYLCENYEDYEEYREWYLMMVA